MLQKFLEAWGVKTPSSETASQLKATLRKLQEAINLEKKKLSETESAISKFEKEKKSTTTELGKLLSQKIAIEAAMKE